MRQSICFLFPQNDDEKQTNGQEVGKQLNNDVQQNAKVQSSTKAADYYVKGDVAAPSELTQRKIH